MYLVSNIIRRLQAWGRRVRNWIWGYDYFISYHWRSGGRYAVALSRMLQDRQFDCFLDRAEFVAGDDWKDEATNALRNTQRLIVIATREAIIESEPVAHEVGIFADRSRHIIPIGFGDSFSDEELSNSQVIQKISNSVLQLTDSPRSLQRGTPDVTEVVNRLITTDKVLRRRKLRLRIVSVSVLVLLIAFVISTFLGILANRARIAEAAAVLNAEERAKEARIEAERAIASQNFAEYLRVSQRAESPGIRNEEQRALNAIAPKYFEQSHERLKVATNLKKQLDEWRARLGRVRPASNRSFSLRVIPTRTTGALLLSYGDPENPELMLIDGGDKSGYRNRLKPLLESLSEPKRPNPLELELVISSQIDIFQIGGLSEMVRELDGEQRNSQAPWLKIKNLWANTFLPFDSTENLPYIDDGKVDLQIGANALGIPVNEPFSNWVACPEAGAARIRWSSELDLTVLAPKLNELEDFARYWLQRYQRQLPGSFLFRAPDLVERFSDHRIELLPAPIVLADTSGTSGEDRSVPNLASIVLMVESFRKRMLITSDSTDTILLQSLAQAGYMDADEICQVDLLVLPHNGSDRNVSAKFFESVVADHYVILGDGRHNNPEVQTMRWLLASRRGTQHPFTIYLTRHPQEFTTSSRSYPVSELLELFHQEQAKGTPFRVSYPEGLGESFEIPLLQPSKDYQKVLVELEL